MSNRPASGRGSQASAADIQVVIGGPEVSYELEDQRIVELADFVITGEGDLAFAKLCQNLLAGTPPLQKVIAAPLPQFDQLRLPYDLYTDEDLAHRVLYVEASRGCPFTCEFCLSALDIPVRQADLNEFLAAMQTLLSPWRPSRFPKFRRAGRSPESQSQPRDPAVLSRPAEPGLFTIRDDPRPAAQSTLRVDRPSRRRAYPVPRLRTDPTQPQGRSARSILTDGLRTTNSSLTISIPPRSRPASTFTQT